MKFFMTFLFLAVATAQAQLRPSEVLAPVEHVFAPLGFDSNDNAQIVIAGALPNLCYKSPRYKISRRDNAIIVNVFALYYDKGTCAQAAVPFVLTVDLGVLSKGTYNILANNIPGEVRSTQLFISEAQHSSVDDFVYAQVDYIEPVAGGRQVLLKGYNPSDCFKVQEVKHINNKSDAYSILPIMKQVSDFCPMKMIPFTIKWDVPAELPAKAVLLHVRSMDGSSVNFVYPNY